MQLFPHDSERSNPVYDGMVIDYILNQIPLEKRPQAKDRLTASILLRNVSAMDYVFNVLGNVIVTRPNGGDVMITTEPGFSFVATNLSLYIDSSSDLDLAKRMQINFANDTTNRSIFAAPVCVSTLGATFANENANYGKSEPFEFPYFHIPENTVMRLSWYHEPQGNYSFKMRAVLGGIKFSNELLRLA